MSAYERGWNAIQRGEKIKANPYRRFTFEWYAWKRGWLDFWKSVEADHQTYEAQQWARVHTAN